MSRSQGGPGAGTKSSRARKLCAGSASREQLSCYEFALDGASISTSMKQICLSLDTVVMPEVPRQRGAAATACDRLQPGYHPARLRPARGNDQPATEAYPTPGR